MTSSLSLLSQVRPFSVGLDNLFNQVEDFMAHARPSAYPHYNIYNDEGGYTIEMALAGFSKEDIKVEHDTTGGKIVVSGKVTKVDNRVPVRQGIATREFVREFVVADGIKVASAEMHDGILSIKLEEPKKVEAEKLLIEVK
jgi:molecular chaperone IbpA